MNKKGATYMAEPYGGPKLPFTHEMPKPPASVKDVPRYLKELLGGFFKRFAYIFRLVWQTGHWIPFLLSFVALFKGFTPVIGSLISKSILNELQNVIQAGGLPKSSFWSSNILYLLLAFFIYQLMLQIVNTVSRALNRIAGEKVVKAGQNTNYGKIQRAGSCLI